MLESLWSFKILSFNRLFSRLRYECARNFSEKSKGEILKHLKEKLVLVHERNHIQCTLKVTFNQMWFDFQTTKLKRLKPFLNPMWFQYCCIHTIADLLKQFVQNWIKWSDSVLIYQSYFNFRGKRYLTVCLISSAFCVCVLFGPATQKIISNKNEFWLAGSWI